MMGSKQLILYLTIVLTITACALWSGENHMRELPLSYSYTVTPDIDPYSPGQIVSLDYSVRLDTTRYEWLWRDRDFVIVFCDDVGEKASLTANDITVLSHSNNRHVRINETNPIVSGHMTFRMNAVTCVFYYTVNVFRIINDPNVTSGNPIDFGSSEYWDLMDVFSVSSNAFRSKSIDFDPAPSDLFEVRPEDHGGASRDPGLLVRGILENTTIECKFSESVVFRSGSDY